MVQRQTEFGQAQHDCIGEKETGPFKREDLLSMRAGLASSLPSGLSAAFAWALARILLAAGMGAALEAALLAMASGGGHANRTCRPGSGTAISFGNYFVGHVWLRSEELVFRRIADFTV
jgi:hypothetical protein